MTEKSFPNAGKNYTLSIIGTGNNILKYLERDDSHAAAKHECQEYVQEKMKPALATYVRATMKQGMVLDDPSYIDSESFDSEKYFKSLLRSKSIDELLKLDNELRKGS
jgi:hypothetical protein